MVSLSRDGGDGADPTARNIPCGNDPDTVPATMSAMAWPSHAKAT
ncbi:hypothetical protein [Lysobacter gummosus]